MSLSQGGAEPMPRSSDASSASRSSSPPLDESGAVASAASIGSNASRAASFDCPPAPALALDSENCSAPSHPAIAATKRATEERTGGRKFRPQGYDTSRTLALDDVLGHVARESVGVGRHVTFGDGDRGLGIRRGQDLHPLDRCALGKRARWVKRFEALQGGKS